MTTPCDAGTVGTLRPGRPIDKRNAGAIEATLAGGTRSARGGRSACSFAPVVLTRAPCRCGDRSHVRPRLHPVG